MWPDIINGLFEVSGGFFILKNVQQILRDRTVRGVHWLPTGFFWVWGCWNIYYYPYLDQWFSFYGGLWIVVVNFLWLVLMIQYWPGRKQN